MVVVEEEEEDEEREEEREQAGEALVWALCLGACLILRAWMKKKEYLSRQRALLTRGRTQSSQGEIFLPLLWYKFHFSVHLTAMHGIITSRFVW